MTRKCIMFDDEHPGNGDAEHDTATESTTEELTEQDMRPSSALDASRYQIYQNPPGSSLYRVRPIGGKTLNFTANSQEIAQRWCDALNDAFNIGYAECKAVHDT